MVEVKICGLKSAAMVDATLAAGADYLGFVFVERSPRFVTIEAAQPLIARAREAGVPTVGLWQQAGSLPLEAVLNSGIDILQAHGSLAPDSSLPTWFAFGVSDAVDLPDQALPCARLLLDAKPPKDAAIEGGHGTTFDWTILRGWQDYSRPE